MESDDFILKWHKLAASHDVYAVLPCKTQQNANAIGMFARSALRFVVWVELIIYY